MLKHFKKHSPLSCRASQVRVTLKSWKEKLVARRRRRETRGVGQSHSPPVPAMYIISGGRGEGNKNRKKTTGILGREERLPRWDVPRVERLQHFTVDLSYRSLFSPSGRWSRINSSSFRISRIHRGRGEKLLEFSIFGILENFLSILARYVNENIFYLLFLPSFLSTRCQISGTKIERSQDLLSASVERELRRELRHLVVHYLASWYQIDALSR